MREIVFRVISETPGHLVARADEQSLTIAAPSLEDPHHEAREALIGHLGTAHGTLRARIMRTSPCNRSLKTPHSLAQR